MKRFLLLTLLFLAGCANDKLVALNEQYSGNKIEMTDSCFLLSTNFKYDTNNNFQYASDSHYFANERKYTYTTLTTETDDAIFDYLLKAIEICSEDSTEYAKYKDSILKVQNEKEELARKNEIADKDCQQAMGKAEKRSNELNNEETLLILDESITTNAENRTSNWSFCLKVIDYDRAGIIVQSSCTFSPLANIFLNPLIGCEEKNYFIVTTDNYADGECYKDWRYLHKDVGVYNWKGKRIRAFRKSNFKVSEIQYQTYLQNKNLRCCNNNGKIGVCR